MTFYPLEKAFLFISQLKLSIKIRAEITKVKNCSVASKNSNNFYKENNLTNFFPRCLWEENHRDIKRNSNAVKQLLLRI